MRGAAFYLGITFVAQLSKIQEKTYKKMVFLSLRRTQV